MTLLGDIIKELDTDSTIETLQVLCDQIFEEELDNIENRDVLPTGPNILLSLEVPGRVKSEIAFLSLERESEDVYLAVLFVIDKKQLEKESLEDVSIKRQRIWQINDHRPEKILTEYAKKYKLLRGK